ncbi:unnamed protein product, partial [Brassica oleracea]
ELLIALLLLFPPSLPPRTEGNKNSEESAHARPYSSDASRKIRSEPIAATTSTCDQVCVPMESGKRPINPLPENLRTFSRRRLPTELGFSDQAQPRFSDV